MPLQHCWISWPSEKVCCMKNSTSFCTCYLIKKKRRDVNISGSGNGCMFLILCTKQSVGCKDYYLYIYKNMFNKQTNMTKPQ